MKKLLFIGAIIAATIISSCSKPKGQLVGVYGRVKPEVNPYGMVFIPRGSNTLGPNDQSATWAIQPSQKTVSIDAFWMDQTEITNGEYRQFVHWVRDSIVRLELARKEIEYYEGDEENPTGKYFTLRFDAFDENDIPDTIINWKSKIPWNFKWNYDPEGGDEGEGEMSPRERYVAINSVFYQGADRTEGKQLNAAKMNYEYQWVSYSQGARPGNFFDSNEGAFNEGANVVIDTAYWDGGRIKNEVVKKDLKTRGDLISKKIINIYPDTMCWMTEYAYSFNEPAMMNYFAHTTYQQFPVVGITWEQAKAFCHWRTGIYKAANKMNPAHGYRLPSEAEWEYAARGGRHNASYPWGGPYVRDNKGCFMANFKPMRGNYAEDGFIIPSRTGSFDPNDYGLFDMSGNVSEWTNTTYDESLNTFTLDFNSSYEYDAKNTDPKAMKRKIIKGGSWKDVGAFLQCGFRSFEYQYRCRPSIGFRCVRSYISEQ